MWKDRKWRQRTCARRQGRHPTTGGLSDVVGLTPGRGVLHKKQNPILRHTIDVTTHLCTSLRPVAHSTCQLMSIHFRRKNCTTQLCAQRIYILAHTMDESIRVSDYFRMTGSQNSSGAGVVNCNCTCYMHVEEHCKMSLTSISLVSGEHVNYIQQVFQVTVHLTTPH